MITPGTAVQEILRTLPSAAGATFLALFPIVNPFGGVPLFFALTADFPDRERNWTALKTALYVLGILVVFMLVSVDPHSPGKYRVDGVVQNMPEFQKAFNCKAGQPMVRENACRVW